MKPELEKLLVLQDRDLRILRMTTELARIPLEKSELERQEKLFAEQTEQSKAESKRIEMDRKKLEMDVEAKTQQVNKYKVQLNEIKNNDQYHALQHEIAHVQDDIRKLEDSELELMEQFEASQGTVKSALERQKEEVARIQSARAQLDAKKVNLEKQLLEVKKERGSLAEGLDENALGQYERIFKSKHGEALVRISHGLCMGCHLKVTTQEIHDAQNGDNIITCTNCGRILYWMPE